MTVPTGAVAVLLHGGPPATVPHWMVLLVVVPIAWLLVGSVVLAVERAFDRLEG